MEAATELESAAKALEKAAGVLTEAALDLNLALSFRLDITEGFNFYEAVQQFEVRLIELALRKARFNESKAARLLGIKNSTLHEKIKRYKIKR